MSDRMRSLSVTVKLTPRQAIAAMRALEVAADMEIDPRAYRVRERVMFGLWDAGWRYDEAGDNAWHHVSNLAARALLRPSEPVE